MQCAANLVIFYVDSCYRMPVEIRQRLQWLSSGWGRGTHLKMGYEQWRNHQRVKGGKVPSFDSEKFVKNQEKEGENQEKEGKSGKRGKNWEKGKKSGRKDKKTGRFFLFAPPDI